MDLYQQIFDTTYETVLASLHRRAQAPDYSLEAIRRELESLYRYDGLDWTGRGDVKQAEIEGSILAYQIFIRRSTIESES